MSLHISIWVFLEHLKINQELYYWNMEQWMMANCIFAISLTGMQLYTLSFINICLELCVTTWCEGLTHLKRPWCWERLRVGEGDNRGWDGRMTSPTQQTWLWVDTGSWRRTGRPGVLRFMGSQRVGHDWAAELNWLMCNHQVWAHEKASSLTLKSDYLTNINPQPLTNLIFPSRKQKYQTLLSYISNVFFFNWRIMASQYCVDFCHTITWISFKYTYVPPSWTSLPSPNPLGPHTARGWAPCVHTVAFPWLSILHMVVYVCPCYSLNPSHPLRPPLCSKSVLYVCDSIPALANERIKKLWYIIYNGLSLTHKKGTHLS